MSSLVLICCVLITSTLLPLNVVGQSRAAVLTDTVIMMSPSPRSVITSNSLLIEAEPSLPSDSIAFIEFRANYFDAGYVIADSGAKALSSRTGAQHGFSQTANYVLVGTDSVAPYQWIMNLQSIQDHSYRRMNIFAVAHSKSNRSFFGFTNDFVIDRVPTVRTDRRATSVYGRKSPDETMHSSPEKSVTFSNGGNTVTFASCWTHDSLFFSIKVLDRVLVTDYPRMESWAEVPLLWLGDDVEIFLDLRNRKSSLADSSVAHIVVSPDGQKVSWLPGSSERLQPSLRSVKTDSGFEVRMALDWKTLGVRPSTGLRMGIDVVNFDRDRAKGLISLNSWCGLHIGNHHNASEWGELVLGAEPRGWQYAMVALFSIFLMVALIRGNSRRKTLVSQAAESPDDKSTDGLGVTDVDKALPGTPETPLQRTPGGLIDGLRTNYAPDEEDGEEDAVDGQPEVTFDPSKVGSITHAMLRLVERDFKNEHMNLDFTARELKRSPKYLSSVFRKETGLRFTEYLNRVRLLEADRLIRNTDRSLFDVSFDVGYSSYEYFSKQYKRRFRASPSSVRDENSFR